MKKVCNNNQIFIYIYISIYFICILIFFSSFKIFPKYFLLFHFLYINFKIILYHIVYILSIFLVNTYAIIIYVLNNINLNKLKKIMGINNSKSKINNENNL